MRDLVVLQFLFSLNSVQVLTQTSFDVVFLPKNTSFENTRVNLEFTRLHLRVVVVPNEKKISIPRTNITYISNFFINSVPANNSFYRHLFDFSSIIDFENDNVLGNNISVTKEDTLNFTLHVWNATENYILFNISYGQEMANFNHEDILKYGRMYSLHFVDQSQIVNFIVLAAPIQVEIVSISASGIELTMNWTSSQDSYIQLTMSESNMTIRFYINSPERMDVSGNLTALIEVSGTSGSCNISGLLPYTNYSIQMIQVASDVSNDPVIVFFTTKEKVPDKILGIRVLNISTTSINVCWDKPVPQPGVTNYTIFVMSSDRLDSIMSVNKTIAGYRETCSNISQLEEYWNYTVSIVASTSVGHGSPSPREFFRTKPGKPGKLRRLDVVAIQSNFTHVMLNVSPPVRVDENSNIVELIVDYSGSNAKSKKLIDKNKISFKELSSPLKREYHIVAAIRAEYRYTFSGYLISSENRRSDTVNITFNTLSGPPPITATIVQASNVKVSDPDTSFAIFIDSNSFHDDTNGIIISMGLIITTGSFINSSSRQREWTMSHYDNYPNWHSVRDKHFTPYRVTPKGWVANDTDYMIGEDRNCGDTKQTSKFCNGPVAPAAEYYAKAFACTRGGCSESAFVFVAATDRGSNLVVIWVTVGLIIATLIAVLLLVVFFFYRMKLPREDNSLEELRLDSVAEDNCFHSKYSRPVRLSKLHEHISQQSRDSNLLFANDYKTIVNESPEMSTVVALLDINTHKNRYTDILPFDETRVHLTQINAEDDEDSIGSDYINANFIIGESGHNEYIAAQGPLSATIEDFVRMIWEYSVHTIVMLTRLVEKNKRKCEQYWPLEENAVKTYGDINVRLNKTTDFPSYTLRDLILFTDEKSLRVKHFHYLSMEDHGISTVSTFVDFIHDVRAHIHPTDNSPVLVHCSAGVGRTGTFIAIDRLRKKILSNSKEVDIFHLVLNLRHQRMKMVQTESQYIFIHECVAHLHDERTLSNDGLYENVNLVYVTDDLVENSNEW